MKNKKIIAISMLCVVATGLIVGTYMINNNINEYKGISIYNDYEKLNSKFEDNIANKTNEEVENTIPKNEIQNNNITDVIKKTETTVNENTNNSNLSNNTSDKSITPTQNNNSNNVISKEENKPIIPEIVEKPKEEVKKDVIEIKINYNAIEKIKQVALKVISENKEDKCKDLQGKQINFVVEKSGNEFYPFAEWKISNIVQGTFFNTFYVYAEDIIKNGVVTQTYYYFQ